MGTKRPERAISAGVTTFASSGFQSFARRSDPKFLCDLVGVRCAVKTNQPSHRVRFLPLVLSMGGCQFSPVRLADRADPASATSPDIPIGFHSSVAR